MNSRLLIAICATAFFLSSAPARGAFTTIVNSPPDAIAPSLVFGPDTQINLHPGSTSTVGNEISLGDFETRADNSELNLVGGSAWAVQAWEGSQINVVDGSIRTANLIGSHGTMSGGAVRTWSLYAGSSLEMTGGVATFVETAGLTDGSDLDTSYFVLSGGEVVDLEATGNVLIEAGTVHNVVFRGGGLVELRGGLVVGGFQALSSGHILIRGSNFNLDGIPLTSPVGGTLVVADRDVPLTGNLADGKGFQFDLHSQPGFGDYFSPNASVAIMFVPEPRSQTMAMLVTLATFATRRLSR